MTKKSAKKLAARARQEARGGKYQNHLQAVGGGPTKSTPLDFFEIISNAIRDAHPDAKLNFVDEDKRLDVRLGTRSFAFLTPRNAEPEWPVIAWNETARAVEGDDSTRELRRLHRRRNYEWECQTLDDVLTVLRWPDVLPSGPYASVNEIRDDHENPSKHVWVEAGGDALTKVFECKNCKQHLHVHRQETAEEVARMGFQSWRERESGTLQRATTLTRSMGVGFIPPRCPGASAGAVSGEAPIGRRQTR